MKKVNGTTYVYLAHTINNSIQKSISMSFLLFY